MPWLEHDPSGWRVVWREGGESSRRQRTPHMATKMEALSAKDRITRQLAAKAAIPTGMALPLEDLLLRWEHTRAAAGNDPQMTARSITRLRHHFKARGWSRTEHITPAAVDAWRRDCSRTDGAGVLIRAFLRWASERAEQPVDARTLIALRPPRRRRTPPGSLLTAEQVADYQQQAAAYHPACGVLVHCLATYGWRPITAARLAVGDVDQASGTVTMRVKGGDIIRHPLHHRTLALLRPLLQDRKTEQPLFVHHRTLQAFGEIDSSSISPWSRNYLGLKVYELKRYAITTMLNAGIAPQDVALFTGHRTISQVLAYARTSEDRGRLALARLSPQVASRGVGDDADARKATI